MGLRRMENRELDVRGTKLVVVDSIFGVCHAPVAAQRLAGVRVDIEAGKIAAGKCRAASGAPF